MRRYNDHIIQGRHQKAKLIIFEMRTWQCYIISGKHFVSLSSQDSAPVCQNTYHFALYWLLIGIVQSLLCNNVTHLPFAVKMTGWHTQTSKSARGSWLIMGCKPVTPTICHAQTKRLGTDRSRRTLSCQSTCEWGNWGRACVELACATGWVGV